MIKNDALENFDENPNKAFRIAVNGFIEHFDDQKNSYQVLANDFYRDHGKEFCEAMVSLGYDGILIEHNNGVKHFVVYNLKAITPIAFGEF